MTTARYWSVPLPSLLEELGTSARGLSTEEAARRSATGRSTRLRRTSRIILAYVLSAEVAKRWFYDGNLDAAGVVPHGAVRIEARRRLRGPRSAAAAEDSPRRVGPQ